MRISIFILAASLLFAACNNNAKNPDTVKIKTEDGSDVTIQANSMNEQAQKMEQRSEELQKLTPLTLDELKALLPEELLGAKKSKQQVTTAIGTGMATAEYKVNDSTELKVTIWDCGGPGGVGFYNMQYMTMFNFESDSDEEYTKTIEFDGKRGFEQCSKIEAECRLTYFGGDRFLVSLDGENISASELRDVSAQIIR